MALPFLTKAIVDRGIQNSDLNIIYLILIGEGLIVVGSTLTDFLSRWLTLHVSAQLNISLKKDFINRLFLLPMRFFDSRKLGDSLRRMDDNKRIQSFLTSDAVGISFTVLSAIVLSIALAYFNLTLFGIFILFSLLYGGWICLFLRRRKTIDYEYFAVESDNQNCTYQLLSSMQETKLQGCETRRRNEWEEIQQRLYEVQMKNLRLQQSQESGAILINELKNIIITVFAAAAVIDGRLSLGDMLAIQFIIGQLNTPVLKIISFIYSLQDLRISFDRINEIKNIDTEDSIDQNTSAEADHSVLDMVSCGDGKESTEVGNALESRREEKIWEDYKVSAKSEDIVVRNVTFRYNRFSPLLTLDDVSAVFSEGKVTAIVGSSGSGKSTLMKLLLGYYRPEKGEILIGGMNLRDIPLREWRQRCGVVMQEGFIYNDTIERNVVMEEGEVDTALFSESLKVANLQNEVNALPLKGATVIGNSGRGLSLGQKQRILIARAVYKQPDVILFDEATNSLDSINEQKIVENLEKIYKGRTVIIIAHRLCTIRNADNIIVMDKGRIAATGTFDHLRSHSPIFYNLVKNQLEL